MPAMPAMPAMPGMPAPFAAVPMAGVAVPIGTPLPQASAKKRAPKPTVGVPPAANDATAQLREVTRGGQNHLQAPPAEREKKMQKELILGGVIAGIVALLGLTWLIVNGLSTRSAAWKASPRRRPPRSPSRVPTPKRKKAAPSPRASQNPPAPTP